MSVTQSFVDSVEAIINVNGTLNKTVFTGTAARRDLQGVSEMPSYQPSQVASSQSQVPSSIHPTAFFAIAAPSSALTSRSPTGVAEPTSGHISVVLFVSGVCAGCQNDLTFGNQVSGRRIDSVAPQERGFRPYTVSSNCFCPINSTRKVGQINAAVLRSQYEKSLQRKNVTVAVNDLKERA